MPKLPVVSGKKVVKALSRIGYEYDYQVGSHIILRNKVGHRLTVPNHSELDKGKVTSIGQITIPKEIREALDVSGEIKFSLKG